MSSRQTGRATSLFGARQAREAEVSSSRGQRLRARTGEPGVLINTGTPPGVGMGFTPLIWLQPGNVMELGIEGLGVQRQEVPAPR